MRGSADTAGMPDVKSRRAFFRFEIVCPDQPLEMKLEFAPDFSNSEMRAARGPLFDKRFGRFFLWRFLALLLWSRFVAPIPTVAMECALRPRGTHGKSSRQKHAILMQLF
jgi:hypothetical protein